MRVDAMLARTDVAIPDLVVAVQEYEDLGYDGVLTAEIGHDPFFPLLLAAEHTTGLELSTSIAVAFARNPMLLAGVGHDLQRYSGGRFRLGLGSQIKAHIEKRFSMPWSHPAPRMRELVLAMRAIWTCWNDGAPLEFRGEFYRHTLMTPMFDPGPNGFGPPPVLLAAVGEVMTEVAGEVADGVILHPFTTERYVREVTVPALERGLARGGRTRDAFEVSGPLFVVTGADEAATEASRRATCERIAFYGSTPAYRPVLELHGWGALHEELHHLSKLGEWRAMGEMIDDDVLDAFAVVAEPDHVPAAFRARFGGVVDRVAVNPPEGVDRDRWCSVLAGFTG